MSHMIACQNVSKYFRRTGRQPKLISQHFKDIFQENREERFYALRDVSFTLDRGQSLAVIGINGAGKSTLLSLMAGVAKPDSGTLSIDGRVAALLELGSGFHPDLTGSENIRLNAAMLGFSRRQTHDLFDSIVDFSGLHEFIHQPLRTYSTGMWMRLAFSVAVNLDPEVLIVDEVLAVGDKNFAAKCRERILELRHDGRTFVCVSHNSQSLLELCDQAIWLDQGQVVMTGATRDVLDAYEGVMVPQMSAAEA